MHLDQVGVCQEVTDQHLRHWTALHWAKPIYDLTFAVLLCHEDIQTLLSEITSNGY